MWYRGGAVRTLSGLLLSGAVAAGPCEPIDTIQKFSVPFDRTFTKPEENATNALYPSAGLWDLGKYYSAQCACSGASIAGVFFYTTTSPLAKGELRAVNGVSMQFYEATRNLQIATEIYIAGNIASYKPTPWASLSNQGTGSSNCQNGYILGELATGNKGKVHLLISRPFVGTVVVPEFKVLDLYAMAGGSTPAATKPVMSLYMSMNVTVPQNCKLAPGQQTSIDFGSLIPSQLASPGAMGQKKVNRNFQIQCTNISAGVKVNLALEGRPHGQDPRYLETTHQDVAVAMESGGKLVAPTLQGATPGAQQLIPIALDYQSLKAQFDLSAWPVKMQPRPEPGAFQGSATLKFDFE